MSYNEDWKIIEDKYDSSSKRSTMVTAATLPGFHLSDILIIRNWISYAKGIGDRSASLFSKDMIFSHQIYEVAKSRAEKYPFENL